MAFACPYCYTKIDKKSKKGVNIICENCGKTLPYGIEESSDLTIAVVGPKGVGKSQFIPMLIRTLQTSFAKEFGTSLVAATEATNVKQSFNIDYLYKFRTTIPETDSLNTIDSASYEPYIYYMRKMGRFNRIKCVTLVFHDTAGEDLQDMDKIPEILKNYLVNADCLIYLADPLQLGYVRACISNDVVLPDEAKPSDDVSVVLSRIVNIIRNYGGSGVKGKLKTNLAVVFTKSDVLFKDPETEAELKITFDENTYVRTKRAYGKVDIENLDKVSSEVEEFVDTVTNSQLNRQISDDFNNYHYFMVSALGQNPSDHYSLVGQPTPFRVEDPLIWLLHVTKSGMVGGR